MGTPNQSSASFMAWVAFSRAFWGLISACSGHRPGATASTRAAMSVPSFQPLVKLFTFLSGMRPYVCAHVCTCVCMCGWELYTPIATSNSFPMEHSQFVDQSMMFQVNPPTTHLVH